MIYRIKCLGEIYMVSTKRLLSMALTRELIQCNNFPTVPNRPYFNNYHCTFYIICIYIICMLYVLSVIKASSIFCMYGLELSQASTGPDQLPSSALFQHDMFPLRGRHIVDQVVGLPPLGQYLLLLTRRISMSFQIWYRDLNI